MWRVFLSFKTASPASFFAQKIEHMSAETTARSKVIIDSNQAEQALNELTQEAKKYKDAMNAAAKANDKAAFDKAEQGWKRTSRAVKEAKKELFSVDSVMKNLSGSSMNQLRAAQRALTSELNKMTRGTTEYIAKSKQLKQVTGEIRKVRTEMTGLSGAQSGFFGKMANGFNRYGGMALGLVASLTGLGLTFRKLANDAEEYQQKVANLSALTGLVGDDLDWLSKKAKELSTSTTEDGIRITKSADEIVDAFTVMGSKKPELLENKEALAAVTTEALKLSEAAQMDTKTAVESLANVMNQFGAEADQASKFINVLAAGSKFGAAAVDKIAESVIRFGPAAASANISVEESVALIETLAEKGVDGQRAGTALRTALLKMQTGADEFNPKVVGLNQALENLKNANLSAGDMVKLFGQEAYTAGAILVENVDRVKHYTDAVTDTNVATEQAIKNTETEKALRQQAVNQFKLAALELGQRLAPALRHVTVTGGTLVKVMIGLVEWFSKYGKYMIIAASAVAGYTIAIKAAIWAKQLYTTVVKIADIATKAFNTTIKMNPIGIFVGLLTAAATAFAIFSRKTKESTRAQQELNNVLEDGANLLSQFADVEDRLRIINELNERQLDKLKKDIQSQIEAQEDYTKKLRAEYESRLLEDDNYLNVRNAIQERMDIARQMREKGINEDRVLAYEKATQQMQEGYLKHYYGELTTEEDKFKQKLDLLKEYLKQVDTEILNNEKGKKSDTIKQTYEDLRDALNDHYAQQRLATQKSYQQGEIDKEQRDSNMQVLEITHLEAMLALQRQYSEETYDTEYKLTQERIKLMESVRDANMKVVADILSSNKTSSDELIEESIKSTNDYIEQQFALWEEVDEQEAKRQAAMLERRLREAEQYKQITDQMAAGLGDLLGRMATDAEMTAQEVIKQFVLIVLDATHAVVRAAIAQIWAQSLASAESVLTWGSAGVAKALAISAIVEAAFAGFKAAISSVGQRAEGKYDVIGADDGRTYNQVPYNGPMRTGVYSRPTLVAERGDELIVDHGTLNNVRVNFPDVLPKIQASMVPQRAAGNVTERLTDTQPQASSTQQADPNLIALMQALNKTLAKGIRAEMSYSHFKAQTEKAQRIEQDSNRNP